MTKRNTILLVLTVFALLSTSCGRECGGFDGSWRLVEYCFGNDCAMLADHGMEQVWEFDNKVVRDSADCDVVWRTGRQRQDFVMNDSIVWSVNADGDTLTVRNPQSGYCDDFYVAVHEKDTLVLTSMMNNILVQQRFVRM